MTLPPGIHDVVARAGLILLYVGLFSTLILTFLGLLGNWVLVVIALVIRLSGHGDLSWTWLAVILGLAIVGELVEALLGAVVVARKGGTRWGVGGAILGGFVGAIAGGAVMPLVGSVVFAFVGAFVGAAVGEFIRYRQVESAMRIGFWSFVGRSLATAAKMAMGLAIIWIMIATTWF